MSTIIKDSLYKTVETSLSNEQNRKILSKYISDYVEKNSHILFAPNFSERLVVSYKDKDFINDVFNVTDAQVNSLIKKTDLANVTWIMNPFNVLMTLAIKYFYDKKMEKEMELCIIFLSCMQYLLLHVRQFQFLPNKAIMDYTLNRNPNVTNALYIKQEGTIFGMIKRTALGSHNNYIESLDTDCTDKNINDYISGIRTRLSSTLKIITDYYMTDHKEGNYFNREEDIATDEKYQVADSTSLAIAKLASKTTMGISSYRFSSTYIKLMANADVNVAYHTLDGILNNIVEQFRLEIEKFITYLIELFIVDGQNNIKEIGTRKFIAHAFSLYKTNSTKPRVISMKETLDKWIDSGTKKAGQRFVREGTINAYRKAIFNVFVYTINNYSKR